MDTEAAEEMLAVSVQLCPTLNSFYLVYLDRTETAGSVSADRDSQKLA